MWKKPWRLCDRAVFNDLRRLIQRGSEPKRAPGGLHFVLGRLKRLLVEPGDSWVVGEHHGQDHVGAELRSGRKCLSWKAFLHLLGKAVVQHGGGLEAEKPGFQYLLLLSI